MMMIRGVSELTVAGYKVGEVEIEFPDGDVDVVRVDTEARLGAFRSLFKSLPIRRLQRNRLEEDHHHQIQSHTWNVSSQCIYNFLYRCNK